MIGLSDPYAVISVGPCAVRSSVVNNNLDPQWNQTFLLYVRSIEKDVLKVGGVARGWRARVGVGRGRSTAGPAGAPTALGRAAGCLVCLHPGCPLLN